MNRGELVCRSRLLATAMGLDMRTFAIPASVEDEGRAEREVRDFVRQWVGLLADQRYAEALDLISPEIPPGSGSVDARNAPTWTPQLLESVIGNYGTPEPVEGQPQSYKVVPLDASLRSPFEENIYIDFDHEAIAKLHGGPPSDQDSEPRAGWLRTKLSMFRRRRGPARPRNHWLGGAEFALPLDFARGHDLSDLSARIRFKPVTQSEMVAVLLDIHVL